MEEVVLLCPIRPRPTGLGVAMRADRILLALARLYRVHLRVVPVHEFDPSERRPQAGPGPATTTAEVWLSPGPVHRLRHLGDPERARLAPGLGAALRSSLVGIDPACVFVFRHVLVNLGFELAAGRMPVVVDLDELESNTSDQLARLHAERGERWAASRMRRRAARYRAREATELGAAAQLWVASRAERDRVRAATGLGARVVPNAVTCSDAMPDGAREDGMKRLLFVGGLGYAPNLDAAEWMASEVLPLLGSRSGTRSVELRIVGAASAHTRRRLGRHPGVRVVGYAESLAEEYARAAVCVVPIRAGGGTRIKLLEALAHGRAAVSTTVGAEGLELEPGRDLLVADDARAFATACNELLADRAHASRLAANGWARVREFHATEVLERAVETASEALAEGHAA